MTNWIKPHGQMYNVETLAAGTQHITQSQTKTVLNALVITKWPPHP